MKKTILSVGIIIVFIGGLFWLSHWKAQPGKLTGTIVDHNDVGQLITIEPEMVSVDEDSYLLGVSGSYPQFSQADEAFNLAIKNFITTDIADFKQSVNDNYKAQLETGGEVFQTQFQEGGLYNYMVQTKIVQSNTNYISAIIRYGGYSGGAHPHQNVITFNYNVSRKADMTLTEFISLENASAKARLILKNKLSHDSEQPLDQSMVQMLLEGTGPEVENFRNFTFTNTDITIYFPEYQVAPYVFGEQQVIIPLK